MGWTRIDDRILVLPAGWRDSMWWQASQVENLEAILREVRATWNVDENRVVAVGGSDGGAALFFLAMRRPDAFAGYAGMVAPPDRLVRADFEPDGQMHVENLARQRFHLDFGERDPKVPIEHLRRYLELFESFGAVMDWHVHEGQGHQLQLDGVRLQGFIDFVARTERDPLPDRLTWSTEDPERFGRRSWISIDELDPDMKRSDVDPAGLLPRWGTRIQLQGKTMPRVPYGTLRAERVGNAVEVEAQGVRRFTLLLSSREFDLTREVSVVLDGQLARAEVPESSARTMLLRAARDDDRTRLFEAAWSFTRSGSK